MSEYSSFELPNGLRVICGSSTSSRVVTLQLAIRAGSAYERETEQGYAHILEHMLLKGTAKRPTSKDIGLVIDRIGAYSNAHTGFESAQFVLQAAAEHTELLFDILSDNIQHALIDPATLENEKNVIMSELLQHENNLPRKTLTSAVRLYFGDHPYSRDPLGIESSIRSASREALLAYLHERYVPNNAVLVVTGNVSNERALELALRYFGSWEGAAASYLVSPPVINAGSGAMEDASPTAYISMLFGTPRTASVTDAAAIECISSYLTVGYSSLLRDELRSKRGLAYNVSSFTRYYRKAVLFGITSSSTEPQKVIDTLHELFESLGNRFDDDVLAKLKEQTTGLINRKLADSFFESDFLALNTLRYATPVFPDTLLSAIQNLSVSQLQETLKIFVDPSQSYTFVLGNK